MVNIICLASASSAGGNSGRSSEAEQIEELFSETPFGDLDDLPLFPGLFLIELCLHCKQILIFVF